MLPKRFLQHLEVLLVICVVVLCVIVCIQQNLLASYQNDSFRVYINFQNETSDYMEFSQANEADSRFRVSPAGAVSLTQLGRSAINNQTKLYTFRQEVRYDDQTFSLSNNTFNLYVTAQNNKIILAEIVQDITYTHQVTFTAKIVDDTTIEITIS